MQVEPLQCPGPDGYSRGRTVVLSRDLYPPRRNFVFCHELAHILLGHTERATKRAADEREADHLAVELMLPEVEFRRMMAAGDFLAAREQCPHASWEVVARRWAELRPAALTIFDNGRLTTRISPPNIACPPRPTPPELDLIRQCYEERRHIIAGNKNVAPPMLKLQAYFVDDGRGFERVILLTEVEES